MIGEMSASRRRSISCGLCKGFQAALQPWRSRQPENTQSNQTARAHIRTQPIFRLPLSPPYQAA
ncbi:hypothetical protein [Kingella oralis]|uniref:hypothetical protein n=1 Tax=Kingella oralis TaxID=505 RepID=UPI002D7EB379|nr:hypothetical protein [Kingella oralis]